jgi:hypothetical protein
MRPSCAPLSGALARGMERPVGFSEGIAAVSVDAGRFADSRRHASHPVVPAPTDELGQPEHGLFELLELDGHENG